MKIISISGLDGSGKSTQIEKLKKHFLRKNQKVFYLHAIEFSLANKFKNFRQKYCPLCRIFKRCKISTENSQSVTRANWLQIQLRKIQLLIDILRFRSFMRQNKNHFDVILSDRYFFDSIINIQYLSLSGHSEQSERPDPDLMKKNSLGFLLKMAAKIIPQPNQTFFLDAEPALIMQRKRVPDQGLKYLQAKRELFEEKITDWQMQRIDGNRNEEEVFGEITESL